jgi:hypothetical protein
MSPSALDKTRNLIALYLHTCGRSEVPAAYHLWSFLTAMAALLADRVYFTKFAHAPLRPNLYTFLIGPSGGGKGEAIDSVLQFVDIIEEASEVFEGATTGQALMEHLGERKSKDNKERRGAILLVHEELSMDVGEGPIAAAFIKHMMGLYKGVLGKALKSGAAGGAGRRVHRAGSGRARRVRAASDPEARVPARPRAGDVTHPERAVRARTDARRDDAHAGRRGDRRAVVHAPACLSAVRRPRVPELAPRA